MGNNNFEWSPFKFMLIYIFHTFTSGVIFSFIQIGFTISKLCLTSIWSHDQNTLTQTYTPTLYLHTASMHNNNKGEKIWKDWLNCLFAWITHQKSHCHFQQYILNYSFFWKDLTFRLGLNTQCPSGPLDCSLFSACQEDTSLDYFLWEVGKQAPRSVS